tara:strand:+ start:289 stop:873 length:585 start_codon:yes stop_codon:yes gene_type:complete
MSLNENPIIQFRKWYDEALLKGIEFPEACCLSTISENNYPDGRMVLMKSFNDDGFVFFTNAKSNKGKHLKKNPRASLTFYWEVLSKQVRIQGNISGISDSDSDQYFSSRPRGSQIGAWASLQSKQLCKRNELDERFVKFEKKYLDVEIPRPPYWKGYLLKPKRIEFWIGKENRLHDRFLYEFVNQGWKINRLYP